jgi:beta-aspartyl-peptidase (threonine type)
LQTAVSRGYAILQKGGSALDAVEQTVMALEDDPVFDAGTGGYLNQLGVVQLDALIVDGARHDFGAVGGVSGVKNPIQLARKIMEETAHCFFVGPGAAAQAEQLGVRLVHNEQLITEEMRAFFAAQRRDGPHDTVGAVAIDRDGNTAVATSTSGTPFKPDGRIGDSPLFGAGGYAANGVGSAGATGLGENIMRVLLAKYTCDQLELGLTASQAAEAALAHISRRFTNSMAGIIVIDKAGRLGVAHSTPKIALGWADAAGGIQTAVRAADFLP